MKTEIQEEQVTEAETGDLSKSDLKNRLRELNKRKTML